jgi:hypothetical protein
LVQAVQLVLQVAFLLLMQLMLLVVVMGEIIMKLGQVVAQVEVEAHFLQADLEEQEIHLL